MPVSRMTVTLERLDGRLLLTSPTLPGWSTIGHKGLDLPRMIEDAWREHDVRLYNLRKGQPYRARTPDRSHLGVSNPDADGVDGERQVRLGRPVKHSSGIKRTDRLRLIAARDCTVESDGSIVTGSGRRYGPGTGMARSTRKVLATWRHVSDEALHAET